MKKARDWSYARVLELYPRAEKCPHCGQILYARYNKRRFIVSLHGPLEVTSHFLECQSAACPRRGTIYRPEEEDRLALPGYPFGLDIVTLIGQHRFSQHQTLKQIQEALSQQYQVSISLKEVQLLSEAFLALVTTVARNDPELTAELRALGSIVLSIDGAQPEKGNETLYLLREVRCGRVLAAANLRWNASDEVAKLIDEVLALGLPIVGVISDHQESIRWAVARKLAGVPHQVCQYHYLQQLALPAVAEDRALKTELKPRIGRIGRIERRVEEKRAAEKLASAEAEVVQDYCLAIRTCMNQDRKYPLDPSGIRLYEHLHQVAASIDRCLKQKPTSDLQSLKTRLAVVPTFRRSYEKLKRTFEFIHQVVHHLEGEGSAEQAHTQLLSFIQSPTPPAPAPKLPRPPVQRPPRLFLQHARKITKSFGQKLFTYLEQPLLPTTNNDLEVFIGQIKKSRRHVTGRKATHRFVLREGAFVAVLFGLPQEINWRKKFGAVPMEAFRTALAKLRRPRYRSKVWLIRRDLPAYLSALESQWLPPPDSE